MTVAEKITEDENAKKFFEKYSQQLHVDFEPERKLLFVRRTKSDYQAQQFSFYEHKSKRGYGCACDCSVF